MVAFVKEWLQQVLIVLVLAAFFDMMIPHNSMHKYIKLVVSLCILLTLLMPLVRWVGGDAREWLAVEWRQNVAAENVRDATRQVVAQPSEWMHEQTESLVEQRMSGELSGFLRSVVTWPVSCTVEATFKNQTVQVIEQVFCSIDQNTEQFQENNRALEERLRSYILQQWQTEVERLHIDIGGVVAGP